MAARLNSMIKILNYKLRKKDYSEISVGIGIDYGNGVASQTQQRRRSKWTIKVYHILAGNASIISYSFQNKKVLYGKVREDVREILNTLCKYKNVEIIAGAVCVDHVHLSVAIPPKLSVSDFMGYLKGKSTLMLYDRYPELQSKWDKSILGKRILCGNNR